MLKQLSVCEKNADFSDLRKHDTVLVAVSGGSDSLALLNLLMEAGIQAPVVATVDHGLRPEAAAEAQFVASLCEKLGLGHQTLVWKPDKPTSQRARMARYDLLTGHARSIGATVVVLGHTMDDQAETLVMRARRMTEGGATRGLAGMSKRSSHNGIDLIRPLLALSRTELREYLSKRGVNWIDDPSNENIASERVRVRHELASTARLPAKQAISRLATATSASRLWMNKVTATCLKEHASAQKNTITLEGCQHLPRSVLVEAFSTLVQVMGGKPFRVPPEKLEPALDCFTNGGFTRLALGNTLISARRGKAVFQRENRPNRNNKADPPATAIAEKLPGQTVAPLEKFRPSCDDPLHQAMKTVLNRLSV